MGWGPEEEGWNGVSITEQTCTCWLRATIASHRSGRRYWLVCRRGAHVAKGRMFSQDEEEEG